jgi:hypothetical protein
MEQPRTCVMPVVRPKPIELVDIEAMMEQVNVSVQDPDPALSMADKEIAPMAIGYEGGNDYVFK